MYLYELANMSNQKKEDIIFWFDQRKKIKSHQIYNPPDKLGKFDLDKDSSDLWVKHTETILNSPWLQLPTNLFILALLEKSKKSIEKH